jgi:hypothetical protein
MQADMAIYQRMHSQEVNATNVDTTGSVYRIGFP